MFSSTIYHEHSLFKSMNSVMQLPLYRWTNHPNTSSSAPIRPQSSSIALQARFCASGMAILPPFKVSTSSPAKNMDQKSLLLHPTMLLSVYGTVGATILVHSKRSKTPKMRFPSCSSIPTRRPFTRPPLTDAFGYTIYDRAVSCAMIVTVP